jgi:stringent starvation protein B
MSDEDDKRTVIEDWLKGSLEKVEAAIAGWKAGKLTVIDAHREVMRHAIEGQEITADVPGAHPAPSKQAMAEHLLQQGPILIICDARRSGVELPDSLRTYNRLSLRFGYNLVPVIPDLTINEQGVSGTLTFNGAPAYVLLPWAAIYAITVDGEPRGMVWHEDVPDDLEPVAPASEPEPEPKRPSHLKLV